MMFQMLVDIIIESLIGIVLISAVTAYLLYRRLMAGIKTEIRVHMSGGTEKRFNAVEVGREVTWLQDNERMTAKIPLTVDPGHTWRWGIHYRVFNIVDGADKVLPVPWLQPNVHGQYLANEAAEYERFRRRVRALDSLKQLASGLSSINRWQAFALITLGWFAGAYLMPLIVGGITG